MADAATSSKEEEGTVVAGGKHTVPLGVAVEELDGGKKQLADACPPQVLQLLLRKEVLMVYDDMVNAIVEEGKTRNIFGQWQDKEFTSIMDQYRDDFAQKGVKLALCKYKSAHGTKRWMEFIDTSVAVDYVPQYDVTDRSGQVISTVYNKLKFPQGVAVEELCSWKGRTQLKEKIPPAVESLMLQKDTMSEYSQLVDACVQNGVGRRLKGWNTKKLKGVMEEYKPIFEAKGVAVFLSIKNEYVSHGQYGGHMEHFRWIEFVDREVQPNYFPQRDADTKDAECVIS